MTNNNSFSNPNTQPQRKVSFLLGFGIFLMPYIFSWFTLRQGHSKTAKAVSFSWLCLLLLSNLLSLATRPLPNDVALNSSSSKTTLNSSLVDTSKTTETKTSSETKNLVQSNSSSAKKAVVITENANLRKLGNSNGEVIQTVSEGTNVEIIKQQGAWFLVKNSGQSGWMHGNTIRFVESSTDSSITAQTYESPSIYSSPYSSYSSRYSGSSSSSYDYRPKTVRVRSYYRKDGTYVSSHTRRAPRRR